MAWLKDVDSIALQSAVRSLADAFDRFFRKQNDPPRFKSKRNPVQSYTTKFTNGNIAVACDLLKLPKLGWVRFAKSREIEGRILSATVRRNGTGMMLGFFLAILNQTLLNVALPHLTADFGVSTSMVQWLLTGYMLVNGVLIPLSAYLIERLGVRLLFLIAMFSFTAGALICSIAPSFPVMLTGHLIQAIGGGVLTPLVMSIILFIFPPEMRGKGMGLFGLVMMFAPAFDTQQEAIIRFRKKTSLPWVIAWAS